MWLVPPKRICTATLRHTSDMPLIFHKLHHQFVEGFHPAYFILNMGIGITLTIFVHGYPFGHHFFHILLLVLFGINCLLFLVLMALWACVAYRNPRQWLVDTWVNPSLAGFTGCAVMGFVTIINFIHAIAGSRAIVFTFTLWWIDSALSIFGAVAITGLYFMPERHSNRIPHENLHLTLLLPIVPMMVAALCGNVLYPSLPALLRVSTLVVTFLMWCCACGLAYMVTTVYMWKLYVHKFPAAGMVFTGFLPVGVFGQGGYGILLWGQNVGSFIRTAANGSSLVMQSSEVPLVDTAVVAAIVEYALWFASNFLLASGFFWTAITLFSIVFHLVCPVLQPVSSDHSLSTAVPQHTLRFQFMRYHKGFWAMTFPLGTMLLLLLENHRLFPSLQFYKIVGCMYSMALLVVVLLCMVAAVVGIEWAVLLADSCLECSKKKEVEV